MRIEFEHEVKTVYKVRHDQRGPVLVNYKEVFFTYKDTRFYVRNRFPHTNHIMKVWTFERSIEGYLAGYHEEGFNVDVYRHDIVDVPHYPELVCAAYEVGHYMALTQLL